MGRGLGLDFDFDFDFGEGAALLTIDRFMIYDEGREEGSRMYICVSAS